MGPSKKPQPSTTPTAAGSRTVQQRKSRQELPYHLLSSEKRLALDIERVDRYRLAVSALGDFTVFKTEIQTDVWAYANRTLPKLIASGKIFGIRSRVGGPHFADLVMPDEGIDLDIAEDLAADTITKALSRFEQSVLRQWDGHRSDAATLGTYFIGLCSLVFPGPFRSWQRETHRLQFIGLDVHHSMSATNAWDCPEAAIYDVEFERHIELIENPLEKIIVRLDSDGLTDREIAEVLDLTEKKVEYRLKKSRLAGQARWEAEQAADDFRVKTLVTA